MNKLFYPAIFHKAEEGGFWVTFPDIAECFTQGDDMSQAYEMAVDALGLALTCREQEHLPLPAVSDPTTISTEPDSFLVVIEFDMFTYKKRTNSRAVKKNVKYSRMVKRGSNVHGFELLTNPSGGPDLKNTGSEVNSFHFAQTCIRYSAHRPYHTTAPRPTQTARFPYSDSPSLCTSSPWASGRSGLSFSARSHAPFEDMHT